MTARLAAACQLPDQGSGYDPDPVLGVSQQAQQPHGALANSGPAQVPGPLRCISYLSPSKLDPLVASGARAAADLPGAVQGADSIHLCLKNPAAEHVRGRVMSLFMACTWGMWRLGSLPVGLAAQAWGPPTAVGLAAALLIALLLPLSRSRGLHAAEPGRSLVHPPPVEIEPAMSRA